MPETLLPPNATALERHLEQSMAHYADGRDVPIDALWDPARCPEALLPWLAWALGVRRWDPDWDADVKRTVIAGAFPLHRIKGTLGALRAHLDAVGAVYDVTERPAGVPFTASITIHNSGAVGLAATNRLRAQIDDVTRLSVEYSMSLSAGIGAAGVTVANFRVEVDAS